MLSLLATRTSASSIKHFLSRTYAVSVKPPRVYDGKPTPRRYGVRKTFLYHQYMRMLEASADSPMIFLQHTNFTVQRLQKLRRDISDASTRLPPSLASPTPISVPSDPPTLTVMRTSLFGVALREFAPMDATTTSEIADLVTGSLAVLTLPSLNPPQMDIILRALDRAVPRKKTQPVENNKAKKREDDPDFVPGRKPQRVKPNLTPELSLVGALIEGRVFAAEGTRDVSKLPTLDTLRAQIVGLISSPATQIAAVLSEASGGRLARTLEGLKKGLEEQQNAESEPSS